MGIIENAFASKTKVRLLRIFYEYPEREFALSDLTKIFKTSTGTIYPALVGLIEKRIILSRKAGRSTFYKLNYKNLLVRKLIEIFESEKKILLNKSNEFARKIDKKNITSIILFGSIARGEPTESSDIDLLIVYKKNYIAVKKNIDKLSEKFLEEDILISPIILSESEVRNMIKKYDSFILRVQEEGKVLFGKHLERM